MGADLSISGESQRVSTPGMGGGYPLGNHWVGTPDRGRFEFRWLLRQDSAFLLEMARGKWQKPRPAGGFHSPAVSPLRTGNGWMNTVFPMVYASWPQWSRDWSEMAWAVPPVRAVEMISCTCHSQGVAEWKRQPEWVLECYLFSVHESDRLPSICTRHGV